MSTHRVVANEIRVGQPLPWNVFDDAGTLLLRRGFVIESARALERLIEEGMFLSDKDSAQPAEPRPEDQPPSTLQLLMDARRLYSAPLQDLTAVRDFRARVQRIAHLVDLACTVTPVVAIASVLLLQKERYAVRHHINTAIVANLICRTLSVPDEKRHTVTAAALTMNLSMAEIHDKLNEVRGPLNQRLRDLIKIHPEQSCQRLRKLGVEDPLWLRCVAQHHECENGAGYPKGLSGDNIEQGAKIISLADRYCAQVSIRHYRPVRPPGAVIRELYIERGAEFNPVVAASLLRLVSIYPPGTVVRLRNGEIAVVVEATDSPDAPIAYAVLGPSGAALAIPTLRKTIRNDYRITDVLTIDKVDFPIQMSRLWGNDARVS